MRHHFTLSGRSRHLGFLFVGIVIAWAAMNFAAVPVAHAKPSATHAQSQSCVRSQFFGLLPWYQYLGGNFKGGNASDRCDLKCFNFTDQEPNPPDPCGNGKSDIPLVLLAVIDDLLRIAAMVTIGFVLYGAFQYVTSQGDPEGTGRAQKTIINSLIGLAFAMTSATIVSFLGKSLGG